MEPISSPVRSALSTRIPSPVGSSSTSTVPVLGGAPVRNRRFDGVSIEDLGSSVGVSGPAVYRHFPGEQAVLAALLVGVSEGLLDGGRAVVERAPDDADALRSLVRFHVDFALRDPDVIRVQDRDLDALSPADRESVRDLQRRYIALWVDVLARLDPSTDRAELRLRARRRPSACSTRPTQRPVVTAARTRALLEQMALAALGQPDE